MKDIDFFFATPDAIENSPYIGLANQTLFHMREYCFGDGLSFAGRAFLKNRTLGVVDTAQKVLVYNPQAARNLGRIDQMAIDMFDLMRRELYAEDFPENGDSEALSRMLLAFGMVPHMAKVSGLPDGVSQHEFEPPFTAEEVLGRIHEVGITIDRIAEAKLDVGKPLLENLGLLRTIWTFQGMGGIRLRTDDTFPPEVERSLKSLKQRFADEGNR